MKPQCFRFKGSNSLHSSKASEKVYLFFFAPVHQVFVIGFDSAPIHAPGYAPAVGIGGPAHFGDDGFIRVKARHPYHDSCLGNPGLHGCACTPHRIGVNGNKIGPPGVHVFNQGT